MTPSGMNSYGFSYPGRHFRSGMNLNPASDKHRLGLEGSAIVHCFVDRKSKNAPN